MGTPNGKKDEGNINKNAQYFNRISQDVHIHKDNGNDQQDQAPFQTDRTGQASSVSKEVVPQLRSGSS